MVRVPPLKYCSAYPTALLTGSDVKSSPQTSARAHAYILCRSRRRPLSRWHSPAAAATNQYSGPHCKMCNPHPPRRDRAKSCHHCRAASEDQ